MSKNTEVECSKTEETDSLPKASILNLLRTGPALEQIQTYRKESTLGFVGLILLAISQLMLVSQLSQAFPQAITAAQTAILEVVVSAALALLGLTCIVIALLKVAYPLPKKVVLPRLAGLGVGVGVITIVKGVALGSLARLLFANDYSRFEMAKTGVDHASMLLGVLVAAFAYSLLAPLLRESKVEFKSFGKSFATLIFWVALIYFVQFVFVLFITVHVEIVSANIFANIAFLTFVVLLSSVSALWFTSLALSFYEVEDGGETPLEDADSAEEESAEKHLESEEKSQENTQIGEDN